MAIASVAQSWDDFLSSGATYTKETTAAPYEKPSSSLLSQFPMRYGLLAMDSEPSFGTDTYNLNDLVSGNAINSRESYLKLKTWLQKHVGLPSGTDIKVDMGLPNTCGLETTANIRPDLFYTYDRGGNEVEEILLIEVDSKNPKTTCRKLAYGLMEQLVRLKTFNNTIMDCVGYYFPAYNRATSVVRIKITWTDEYLSFTAVRNILSMHEVVEIMKSDLKREVDRWKGIPPGTPLKKFNVVLTSQFVRDKFGATAIQLQSGESVVILDRARSKIFKHNFSLSEALCAERLLFRQIVGDIHLERSLLPMDKVMIGDSNYLIYKLLLKPLSRTQARESFGGVNGFAAGVVIALRELHNKGGLAHLDVRLENICFDPQSHTPILIDLDRSGPIGFPFNEHIVVPPPSTMYAPPDATWPLEKVDLIQLGLMFCYILDDSVNVSAFDYHRYNPSKISQLHPYLSSLFNGTWPSVEQESFILNPTLCL